MKREEIKVSGRWQREKGGIFREKGAAIVQWAPLLEKKKWTVEMGIFYRGIVCDAPAVQVKKVSFQLDIHNDNNK